MMRSADSCASLMTESVRSVDAGGNDSDAPADTPTAPNFYQGEEEEEEEDESVVSSLHTKVKHHLEDGEDETQDVSFVRFRLLSRAPPPCSFRVAASYTSAAQLQLF